MGNVFPTTLYATNIQIAEINRMREIVRNFEFVSFNFRTTKYIFNAGTCSRGEFRCNTGECIPASRRCDLRVDCHDGSDENDCSKYCIVLSRLSVISYFKDFLFIIINFISFSCYHVSFVHHHISNDLFLMKIRTEMSQSRVDV